MKQLGLDRSKPIITFRTEETFAAYLLGKTPKESLIVPIAERLLKSSRDFQLVVLPRYKEQAIVLKEVLGKNAIICESVIDGPSLLSFTSIFVGAGGTMTIEAVLLGVPTFSCYPDKPFLIERYLINKGLIVRETSYINYYHNKCGDIFADSPLFWLFQPTRCEEERLVKIDE